MSNPAVGTKSDPASGMTPRDRLERLAAGWRRRRAVATAAAALAAGLLAAAVASKLAGAGDLAVGIAGLAAAAIVGALGAIAVRRAPVTAREVAAHLDRMHPSLEYSSALLLTDEPRLLPLERVQRQRTVAALARLDRIVLPHRMLRRSAAAAAVMLATAAGLVVARPGSPEASAAGRSHLIAAPRVSGTPGAPALGPIEIVIEPPSYTGRPRRHATGLDVEAESDARVTWRTVGGQSGAVFLVTAEGDTMPFRGSALSLTATRPLLYQLLVQGENGATAGTELHQLMVRPDRPPTLTITAPPPRTILAPGESHRIPVHVEAHDDYGLGAAEIVATITTGRGESVRFREERLAFAERRARGAGTDLRTLLDLGALGLAPGDELYFHVVASDNRRPVPNRSRSATHFISLLDTAAIADADFGGLPVSRLPEYFRSQRQIIIDTERLLAEAPRLERSRFAERSNGIGIDQGLLRMRYGAIVGDETEGGAGDPSEGHDHDTEENATLLAGSVKSTLKAALAEMWQAELKLRTSEPRTALPHEYRALEHLKAVQQAARSYVQRVGSESPPLQPDLKRLTGERREVADRQATRTVQSPDPDAALRAVLAVLGDLGYGADAHSWAALQAAHARLTELATAESGRHLATLRTLRRLTDSLGRGAPCEACADSLAVAIRRVLPPLTPVAGAGGGASAPAIARDYFDRLRAR